MREIFVLRDSEPSGNNPAKAVDRAEFHARCTFGVPSVECVSMAQTISLGVEKGDVSHKT